MEKCAGVWGRCGKVFRKVRKILGVGVKGVGSGKLESGSWGRGC